MAKVVMYTKDPCPFCVAAKQLLTQRGIEFEEVQLDWNDQEAMAKLVEKSGMRTVPQIFNGDELIGGFDQLAELDKKDLLKSLKD